MPHNLATESEEQCALIEWAIWNERQYPALKWLFAIPNGGLRSKATAGRLKAEGVKKGVPDLFLPIPHGGHNGLFIEMKVGRNKTTAEQREWLSGLKANGYKTAVCYGSEAAIRVIVEYLEG